MKSFPHRRRWLSEDNPQIRLIKAGRTGNRAENRFQQIGGATDARLLRKKGDGDNAFRYGQGGMHADGEYVVWQSVEELARIQIEYLKSLANA